MSPRASSAFPFLLALAGCASAPTARPERAARAPEAGLDRVMGKAAPALAALFGAPALDIHEGAARKLQYRGPACILDAYLYPPPGGGEPRVTWIDARTPSGADLDRASCIAALARVPLRRR